MNDTEAYKVSIIVPVYNKEPALKQCLDSIIEQTYTRLEIILVDDGSKDRSGELCEQYAARDRRVTVIHQKNGGAGAARNTGMDHSSGDLLYFVDADDYLTLDSVEILIKYYDKYKCDLTVGAAYFVLNGVLQSTKKIPQNILWEKPEIMECVKQTLIDPKNHDFFHRVWGRLFVSSVIKQNNIRFSLIRNGQDCQFSYDYLVYAQDAFLTDEFVYNYDICAANSISSMTKSNISFDDFKLFQSNNEIFFSMRKLFLKDSDSGRNWDMEEIDRLLSHAKVYTFISVLIRYCRQTRLRNFFKVRAVIKTAIEQEELMSIMDHYMILEGNNVRIPQYIKEHQYTKLILEAKRSGDKAFGKHT